VPRRNPLATPFNNLAKNGSHRASSDGNPTAESETDLYRQSSKTHLPDRRGQWKRLTYATAHAR
jgi:hypothetical protein